MIRDTARSFGLVTILFHWIMAGLFLVQFWIGLTMESEPDRLAKATLMSRHVSLGFLILFLWIVRALWKLSSTRPALPEAMENTERRIALAVHGLLFWLLAVIPLAGWAILSSASGPLPLPISVFGIVDMPRLPVGASSHAAGTWTVLHAFLAYFMLVIAGVHALAALRHQFTLKDGLLTRMILPGRHLAGD